jgi:hypothetical protein
MVIAAEAPPGPEMRDLLYRDRLIVLKDQVPNDQASCDFAGRFGLPVPYLQEH